MICILCIDYRIIDDQIIGSVPNPIPVYRDRVPHPNREGGPVLPSSFERGDGGHVLGTQVLRGVGK